MLTDLVRIHELGTAKAAENQDFRRYLEANHHRIGEFQKVAVRVQEQMDCTACANCCRYSVVQVSDDDLLAIATYFGVSAEEAAHLCTTADPDATGKRILQSSDQGCVFLDGNLCLIYEARPRACRDFPCVTPGNHALGARLSSICRWAALCPIIYNALEEYKHLVGFHAPGKTRH